ADEWQRHWHRGSDGGFAVDVPRGGEVVEGAFEGDFVEKAVPEGGVSFGGGCPERGVFEDVFAPFFQGVHAEDDLVGDGFFEVCVFDSVAGVRECDARSVRPVFSDGVVEGPSIQPVKVLLEAVLGLGRVRLHVIPHVIKDLIPPGWIIFPVVQKPLPKIRNNALVRTPTHYMAVRLGILKCITALYQLGLDFGFRSLNRFAFEVSDQHSALVVTFLVGKIFGVREQFRVFCQVAVGWGLDNRKDLQFCPFLLDTIVVCLLRKVVFLVRDSEYAVFDLGTDKTASLTIHGLRAESSRYKVDVCRIGKLALQKLGSLWSPLFYFQLQSGILLRRNTFAFRPVVIHTRLAIFGGVYGIAAAILYLVELLETVHLPTDESVVIWREHDLELVSQLHPFRHRFAFLGGELGDIFLRLGLGWGWGDIVTIPLLLLVLFKVLTESADIFGQFLLRAAKAGLVSGQAPFNPYKARKPWPPDFSKLDPKYQFRLERRYRRRSNLKWMPARWVKGVKLAQWGICSTFKTGFRHYDHRPRSQDISRLTLKQKTSKLESQRTTEMLASAAILRLPSNSTARQLGLAANRTIDHNFEPVFTFPMEGNLHEILL
ncbi:MAG: hypothetical protein Q9224_001542, partial [Gallowayella concinna]